MANTYIVPNWQIKDNTFIDNNVDDKTLKVALLDTQNLDLRPVLGDALYEKILVGSQGTMPAAYQTMTVKYIWPILFEGVQIKLYYNLLFRITRRGVVSDEDGITVEELNVLIKERERSMNHYTKTIRDYLLVNQTAFPEFLGAQPDDGETPDLSDSDNTIWDYDEDTRSNIRVPAKYQ